MNCFCPKCNASIAPDLPEVPSDGAFLKCPECSASFNLHRESFANRALRSGDAITCAECGNPPGPAIYCQHCHVLYPDYYVTETTSAAKKKLDKLLAALTKPKKHKTGSGHYTHEARQSATTTIPVKGINLPVSGRLVQILTTLLILGLFGGGGFYYYRDKIETEYATKYVRTIFIIKTTADSNIRLSTKLVNDWRASLSPAAPRFTSQEQKSLTSGKSDADILMKRIGDPPKRLIASQDPIKKFYDSYVKLYDLNSIPPTSLDTYATTAKKLEDNFRKSGRELKGSLPPQIAESLKGSLSKYKNLNDL